MKRSQEGDEREKHTQRMETRNVDNTAEKKRSLEMFRENSRDKKIERRKPTHTSLEPGKKEAKTVAPNKCFKCTSRNLSRNNARAQ